MEPFCEKGKTAIIDKVSVDCFLGVKTNQDIVKLEIEIIFTNSGKLNFDKIIYF